MALSYPEAALSLARPTEQELTASPALEAEGLRVTSPAPRREWREVLEADADALIPQSPEWVDAMCANEPFEDASRFYETQRGIRIVLPMVRRTGPWPSSLAPRASMPMAWGMGGMLVEGEPTERELAAVVADVASAGALRTQIRPNPLRDGHWSAAEDWGAIKVPRRAHVLDLRPGVDEIWKTMKSEARRAVRKAERTGVEVESASGRRLVGDFYRLLELSVERWAAQQHEPLALARWRARRRDPLEKFEQMADSLGDGMRIWVARLNGAPVASTVVLSGANVNDTRGAMDKERIGNSCANDLIEWLTIKEACEAGCHQLHLGESGTSRNLARFKEKWGAQPVDYNEYRFERLPLSRADSLARGAVKRVLKFKDA
jgi:hypothetical protein